MRACAGETHMDMSQERFCVESYRKMCGDLQEKCRTPSAEQPVYAVSYRENPEPGMRGARFVRACAVEMHMDMSQVPFDAVIFKKKGAHPFRARHFARACAIETHMDISQEPFFQAIYTGLRGFPCLALGSVLQ